MEYYPESQCNLCHYRLFYVCDECRKFGKINNSIYLNKKKCNDFWTNSEMKNNERNNIDFGNDDLTIANSIISTIIVSLLFFVGMLSIMMFA